MLKKGAFIWLGTVDSFSDMARIYLVLLDFRVWVSWLVMATTRQTNIIWVQGSTLRNAKSRKI